MRKTIFAAITILMLAAMPTSVFAFEYGNPDHPDDTNFETFGPRCDNLLIKQYPTEWAVWDSLEQAEIDVTDTPLDAQHYESYNTAPLNASIRSVSYGPEFGLFLFDLNNNNNPFLGNPQNESYTNPVYPNPMSVVELRKAVAYLSDRTYVINEVIGAGFAFPVYTPMSPASGFYVHPEIMPGGALEELCYLYDPTAAIAMLDDSGKFPIGLDGWRYWDMDLDGVKDEGEELVLKLFARSETPPMLEIALKLYYLLENSTKIHVNFVPGDRAAALVQVMLNKDFHIYTGSRVLPMDPTHLIYWHWDYYWHPGQCPNYAGCNVPEFNDAADGVQYANTIEDATFYAHLAQEVFATYAMTVPLWTVGGNKAFSRTYVGNTPAEAAYHGRWWRNLVNIPGYGVDSYFTFLSMRPCEITPRAINGTIRYGIRTISLNSMNPIYSNWATDIAVIDFCGYESLLYREPYSRMLRPWLCDSFTVGTYEPTPGDVRTAINFTMRRDAHWSDGTPITFEDIEYTLVQMKYDLAARGLPPPWWIGNTKDIIEMVQYSSTKFEIRLDVKSVFAVGWVGLTRILPKHIWEPICKGLPRPSDGLPWDPTTFAPDINIIHSGPWCFDTYETGVFTLLRAHKPGVTVTTSGITDPNWAASLPITSPYGFFRYFRDEDLDKDDKVNILDAILLAGKFGKKEGDVGYSRVIDINGDGRINVLDAILLAGKFGWPNNEKVECAAYGGPYP